MTFYGDPAADVEVTLQSPSGQFLAHWPSGELKNRRLRWPQLALTAARDEKSSLALVPDTALWIEVSDQNITIKPMRSAPEDKEVMVRTEIKGKGDAIQLDYRLEKTPGQGAGWKIYNI